LEETLLRRTTVVRQHVAVRLPDGVDRRQAPGDESDDRKPLPASERRDERTTATEKSLGPRRLESDQRPQWLDRMALP
jgi:hypothetical protein